MLRTNLAPGEYYHICNRGVGKQTIFSENGDYFRFLFLILYFQSMQKVEHIGRAAKDFAISHGQHPMLAKLAEKIIKDRTVELVAFCFMSNHFHLIVKEVKEGGISSYMQRALNAYGKYYNTKYKKSGHVFQGPYRARHIADDRYMHHLSAYIHRNPRETREWRNKYAEYEWSSCQDFVRENRWEGLLVPEIILGGFKDKSKYQKFLKTSPTKVLKEEDWDIRTLLG